MLAGAAVVAAEFRVDANLADEQGLPLADPHGIDERRQCDPADPRRADVVGRALVHGHRPQRLPDVDPADVTYFVDEARAAFFPLFPLAGRLFDRVLPGGDSFAVLVMNTAARVSSRSC